MLEVTSFDDNVLADEDSSTDRKRKLPLASGATALGSVSDQLSPARHEFPGLTLIKGSDRGSPSTSETVSPIR